MPDRLPFEQVNCPADSANEVHEINMDDYGKDSIPKGYARTSPVEQDVSPADSDE
jgi:hypothetical protein